MNKQHPRKQAYQRLVDRGVEPDDKTWEWACLIVDQDNDSGLTPEELVDEELDAAAQNQ